MGPTGKSETMQDREVYMFWTHPRNVSAQTCSKKNRQAVYLQQKLVWQLKKYKFSKLFVFDDAHSAAHGHLPENGKQDVDQ